MSNDPRADLIYAILSMDSYNRGYGTGINGLNESGKIGSYTIGENANQDGWFKAGFYAIAYKNGADTVIAYRGTDVKGLFSSATKGGSDPLNGYSIALGGTPDSSSILPHSRRQLPRSSTRR